MMTSQTKTGRCALTAKNPKLTAAMTAAEKYLGLLLWTLYHHQGGSSNIGQPIRRSLGMGQYDLMTDEQIAYGKAAADFYHSTGTWR